MGCCRSKQAKDEAAGFALLGEGEGKKGSGDGADADAGGAAAIAAESPAPASAAADAAAATTGAAAAGPKAGDAQGAEDTFAWIKPDAFKAGHAEAILGHMQAAGFEIVRRKKLTLTREQAEAFYEEHRGKPFFEKLTSFMSSGPAVAVHLRRVDAIAEWRRLMGPTNSDKAREEAPESMRARYGTDGSFNATHGSDSPASAARELELVFETIVGEREKMIADYYGSQAGLDDEAEDTMVPPDEPAGGASAAGRFSISASDRDMLLAMQGKRASLMQAIPEAAAGGEDKTKDGGPDRRPMGVSLACLRQVTAMPGYSGPTMTTHEVVEALLKPKTAPSASAYYELLGEDAAMVGPANVFVSHCYSFPFQLVIDALDRWDTEQRAKQTDEPLRVWFDPFCFNAHTGETSPEYFATSFRSMIKQIGEVCLVLGTSWRAPETLQRMWCLFEMAVAIDVLGSKKFNVLLPAAEEDALIAAISDSRALGYGAVLDALTRIDSYAARCNSQRDDAYIRDEIQRTITFHGLNSRVKAHMRAWAMAEGLERVDLARAQDATSEAFLAIAYQVASMCRSLGNKQTGLELAEEACALAESRFPARVATYLLLRGLLRDDLGDVDGALADVERVVEMREATFAGADGGGPAAAAAAGQEGEGEGGGGGGDDGDDGAAENPGGDDDATSLLVNALSALALIYKKYGRYDETERMYLRCVELNAGRERGLAASYNNLGTLAAERDDFVKGEEWLSKSLAIKRRIYPSNSPRMAAAHNNMGVFYDRQGKVALAEEQYRQALTIKEELFEADSPEVAVTVHNIGVFLKTNGRLDEADAHLGRALTIYAQFDAANPMAAGTKSHLGHLRALQGRFDEAEQLMLEALAVRKTFDKALDLAKSYQHLAWLDERRGGRAEAAAAWRAKQAAEEGRGAFTLPEIASASASQ